MTDYFTKARISLTLWYLLIIMVISIAFSLVIYVGATREFDRLLRTQRYRIEHSGMLPLLGAQIVPLPSLYDPDVIEEAKLRVIMSLIGINTVVLILSAVAGYFLAGRTLRPIQEMIDDQNRFITDASHELHTPLTSLRTSIEVNLRNSHLTVPKAKDVLQSNLEDVRRLQALSGELLQLAQFEKPRSNIFQQVSIQHTITQAIKQIQSIADNKEITILAKTPQITIRGEEKSFVQLFVILLDNAIKYSPSHTKVTIAAKKTDGHVRITVQDMGMGIPPEDITHIFERFYRADKSRTSQKVEGYGLGLSIAKRIVDFYEGEIILASTEKKGTTATVIFPVI